MNPPFYSNNAINYQYSVCNASYGLNNNLAAHLTAGLILSDMNNYIDTGNYLYNGWSEISNRPTGANNAWGVVYVTARANYVTVFQQLILENGLVFCRKRETGVWGGWYKNGVLV